MKTFIIIAAVAFCVALSASNAVADTWSCAVNKKIGGATIEQYRLEGAVLKDLTSDKIMREWMPASKEFLGPEYKVLVNNKDAIIAETDNTDVNSQKIKEIYVVNIIINKHIGTLIKTSILLHLPEPNEIGTIEGSCTFDK